jgi:hypothetical protein
MKMTFEIFLYRAQTFAVKLQQSKPGTFVTNLKIGFGGMITQLLMGMAFAKCYAEGERQWRITQSTKKTGVRVSPKSIRKGKNNGNRNEGM